MIPCNVKPPYRVPFASPKPHKIKGTLSEVNSSDPFFYTKHHLDGSEEIVYHVNIIDILDNAFIYDAKKFLSRKQEAFIDHFIKAAGIIDERYSNQEALYTDIDPVFVKLDHFLGNYIGVDEDEYTR